MTVVLPLDVRMDALDAAQVGKVSTFLHDQLGVEVKQDGPVTTLVHAASGAWVQQQGVTVFGAWRVALHMAEGLKKDRLREGESVNR